MLNFHACIRSSWCLPSLQGTVSQFTSDRARLEGNTVVEGVSWIRGEISARSKTRASAPWPAATSLEQKATAKLQLALEHGYK